MKLYDKEFLIYGNCMIRNFGQPGQTIISKSATKHQFLAWECVHTFGKTRF